MRPNIYDAVDNLNKSYMGKSKNTFKVSAAYGGYKVILEGKYRRSGRTIKQIGIEGAAELTYGYVPQKDALAQLAMMLSNKDYIKIFIKRYEPKKSR